MDGSSLRQTDWQFPGLPRTFREDHIAYINISYFWLLRSYILQVLKIKSLNKLKNKQINKLLLNSIFTVVDSEVGI